MNPINLSAETSRREAAARHHKLRVDAYLQVALIATEAVYTAAAAGNVTCKAAALRIDALIGPVQTPAPAGPPSIPLPLVTSPSSEATTPATLS